MRVVLNGWVGRLNNWSLVGNRNGVLKLYVSFGSMVEIRPVNKALVPFVTCTSNLSLLYIVAGG